MGMKSTGEGREKRGKTREKRKRPFRLFFWGGGGRESFLAEKPECVVFIWSDVRDSLVCFGLFEEGFRVQYPRHIRMVAGIKSPQGHVPER